MRERTTMDGSLRILRHVSLLTVFFALTACGGGPTGSDKSETTTGGNRAIERQLVREKG